MGCAASAIGGCALLHALILSSTQMEDTAPDRKPGNVLSLYLPATLGVLTAAISIPYCDCELTWSQLLLGLAIGPAPGFIFWWITVMVCFHGYHFVRALFHHPN
jgi:hypothetical protein